MIVDDRYITDPQEVYTNHEGLKDTSECFIT